MSDPTPDVREGDRAGTAGRRYRAFISYSHADTRWANWLMRRLEGYRVPRRFQGRVAPIGEVGARIAPVFRDRDELATTSDLGEAVRGALRAAETLVVICSPRAAASRWVNEEICEFKRRRGSRQVFALIVDGEPKAAGTAEDCFPRALRFAVGDDGMPGTTSEEVVAADARPQGDGPRLAFVRLVAGLLGVGFDDLRQRELLRRQRRLTLIAAAAVAGMVITLGLAAAAWRARNEAVVARNDAQRRQDQAEDVLSFMLGDFRADLEKVGQLSLLERVGDKAMGYFDALEPSDLTDTALARQAKALTQIGEVKLLQKNVSYAEAGRAFFTAYQRAAALAARYPKNGDMLFERAQAEYWIGFTHLRRGDLAPTAEWFERYRDSTETLAALDPRNLKWRREQLSGQHNLAVLEFERGNLEAARGSLERQRESLLRLRAEVPDNRTFQFRVTDVDSWLGAVAEREGRLPEAVERFAAQRAGLERLLELEPTNSQWRFKLADCLMWETDVLAIVGEVEAARGRITRSEAELQALLARDPQNRRWSLARLELKLKAAALTARQEPAAAVRALAESRATLEAMLAKEASDRVALARLLTALRWEFSVALESGAVLGGEAVARLIDVGERLVREDRANYRSRAEFAQGLILAGRHAAARGRAEEAAAHWRRVRAEIAVSPGDVRNWRFLDPQARAGALLGDLETARGVVRQLEEIGYRPVEPWPGALRATNSVSKQNQQE